MTAWLNIWEYYEKHKSVVQIYKILNFFRAKVRNAVAFYKEYGTCENIPLEKPRKPLCWTLCWQIRRRRYRNEFDSCVRIAQKNHWHIRKGPNCLKRESKFNVFESDGKQYVRFPPNKQLNAKFTKKRVVAQKKNYPIKKICCEFYKKNGGKSALNSAQSCRFNAKALLHCF